jgi:hypothetical protein
MKYMRNGFHYVILNYGIAFYNVFEFKGWSIYSISKLPFWQILLCDKCGSNMAVSFWRGAGVSMFPLYFVRHYQ